MTHEEFKGWLRGYLEGAGCTTEKEKARILGEAEKVTLPEPPVQVLPYPIYPIYPTYPPYPSPFWIKYDTTTDITWTGDSLTVPVSGDGFAWNEQTVSAFNRDNWMDS